MYEPIYPQVSIRETSHGEIRKSGKKDTCGGGLTNDLHQSIYVVSLQELIGILFPFLIPYY